MRVLVAAASKHGSTFEIAEAIGRGLTSHGLEVDVRRLDDVRRLESYDAVVLGSAVYAGHWMHGARDFVDEHEDELTVRPLWLFSSGPLGAPPHPIDEHAVNITDILLATDARDHRLFAGRLDRYGLGFGERAVALAVQAPEGDFRDWEAIAVWAAEIAAALASQAAGTDTTRTEKE
jgi:menaquinone-dependent protoporphyrinogen oxidase